MNKTKSLLLLLILVAIISIISYSFGFVYNNTASMSLGFYKLDKLEKYTPKKEDIIVLKIPKIDNKLLKKVVGVAGDKVIVSPKGVYINDMLLKNSDIFEFGNDGKPLQANFMNKVLEEDEIFVMGENNMSYDSRYFGVVNLKVSKIEKISKFYTWENTND